MRAPPRFPAPDEPGRRRVLRWMGAGSLLAGGGFGTALAQTNGSCGSRCGQFAATTALRRPERRREWRRAIVWSRRSARAPARRVVATTEAMRDARRLRGPGRAGRDDFTARVDLTGLPAGQRSSIASSSQDLADPEACTAMPVTGRFRTPLDRPRDVVSFAFSGDEAGQGWGINAAWGGIEDVRGDAPHRARLLHPLRRSDLRRRSDRGRGHAGRRHALEQRHDPGQVQGGRDARGVPRQLRLQPARREQAPLLRRGADARPVGRPRDAQQLVPRPADRSSDERYQRAQRVAAGRLAKRAMFDYNPLRFDPIDPERVYRSFRLRAARSRSSCSTSAAIAGRTRRTASRRSATSPLSSGPSSCAGSSDASDLPRHVEGDRQRHAAVASSCPTSTRTFPRAPSRRGPTPTTAHLWARAGAGRAAALHQEHEINATWSG